MGPEELPAEVLFVQFALLLAGIFVLLHHIRRRPQSTHAPSTPPAPPWTIAPVDFVAFVFLILLSVFIVQILLANLFADYFTDGPASIVLFGISFHGGVILGLLLFHRFFRHCFVIPMNTRERGFSRLLLWGGYALLAAWPVVFVATLAWATLLHIFGIDTQQQELVEAFLDTDQILLLALMAGLAVFVAPVTEELVFRGFLYRYFKAHMPAFLAIGLNAVLFSLMHWNVMGFVPLMILGAVLCYAYDKSGHIGVPIVIHALYNLHTVVLLLIFGLTA